MRRFLIADDHEMVRRGLRGLLVEAFPGAEIVETAQVAETIGQVHRTDFDLVLLDINMPGRSGLEVLEEVRRLKPRVPVLVLSAYPEQEYAVRSIQGGAAGYLTKQSAADELLAAIRKVLAGGKYVSASLAERLAQCLGGDWQPAPHETLSTRELQVLRGIAQGQTLKEIAAALGLSEKTVGTYRARISEKMRLRTNVELTRYAVQRGLID